MLTQDSIQKTGQQIEVANKLAKIEDILGSLINYDENRNICIV